MDPNHAMLFAMEKKRHGGGYFDMTIGLLYRGKVRAFLDQGVVADDLFYVEVKDWGVSHFYVTGPHDAQVHYAMRIRSWLDQIKERERQEELAETRAKLAAEHARRHRWDWLKGLLGLIEDKPEPKDPVITWLAHQPAMRDD